MKSLHLLFDQRATEFRVRAYRNAADTLRRLNRACARSLNAKEPKDWCRCQPLERRLQNLIEQQLRLGRMPLLDRLRGEVSAEQFFTTLPGVGPELSHRIHETLHVETLPELYAATVQGRLDQVPGIGRKRASAIRESLAQRMQNKGLPKRPLVVDVDHSVPVDEILEIDEEYRHLASKNKLPKIAPRKFNPGNIAWLPVLHTERNGRHYSALFSNTARAHDMNTTKDWVVIYRDDADSHGRWTVITSQFGKLQGCRIVRGREDECRSYYNRLRGFTMRAMVLTKIAPLSQERNPLRLIEMEVPVPCDDEILLRISACGVCHTELDEIEGRLKPSRLPIVLGHEVVGRVVERGSNATRFNIGDRAGVGWIHRSNGSTEENWPLSSPLPAVMLTAATPST